MTELRIIFLGTSAFAVPALRALVGRPGLTVVAVVAQPDKPQGRHAQAVAGPVAAAARELHVTLLQPEKLKDAVIADTFKALQADVAVVAAYGRIIPEALLAIPRLGTLNIHPSMLPRWRGPSPIQSAIAQGDAETGVSIMVLDAEMDHGPLLAQTRVPLSGKERHPDLEARLAAVGAELLAETLPRYADGSLTARPQEHGAATFCNKLERDSGRIDWTKRAAEIERLERAMDPWPGVWTEWIPRPGSGQALRVKLFDARVETEKLPSGSLAEHDGRLFVGTGTEAASFGYLQVEGKKRLLSIDLLRGMRGFLNGRFI